MRKQVAQVVIVMLMSVVTTPVAASEVLMSPRQVQLAASYSDAHMLERIESQAIWNGCETYREVWQESFSAAGADLERSFAYYASASADEIRAHREAFELVHAIADHYQHNHCTAIPGTYDVISKR